MVDSEFENINMGESDSFSDFYNRLSLLVNAARNLGETITKEKIVKKIFRVLPSKFVPKKAAIEEHSLLSEINLDILISKLITFEMELSNYATPKKSKIIAL